MFKYSEYIKEDAINGETEKFSIGDKVIFKPASSVILFYKKYNGKIGEIIDTSKYNVRLRMSDNRQILASYDEISKDTEEINKNAEDEINKNNNNKMRKFKVGDKVIFTSLPERNYYKKHDGKICTINFCYPFDEYQILTPDSSIMANVAELRHVDDPASSQTIDTGSSKKTPSDPEDLSTGQRVVVNGFVNKYEFKNRKGTIKKVSSDSCVVEFDEDESKNLTKFSMVVDKNIVKPINEPMVVIMKTGDKVLCTDRNSEFFNKNGVVTKTWPDGQAMVEFKRSNGTAVDGIIMKPEQVKITEYYKSKPFNKTEETSVPVNVISETEEEDEDEDDETSDTKTEKIKKTDLLECSYKDFLLSEKISTKEDLLKNKDKYENILKNKDLPEFKSIVYEKSLRIAEIVEQYFNFLEAKIAKGLPVYRTVEQIDNMDLLVTKTKIRANESKELSRKYSFDQGIIAYWKFKDAVVFRTI